MRKIFILLSVSLAASVVSAQSLQILSSRIEVKNVTDRVGRVALKNNSSSAISVKVERIVNTLATGHESSFCWDMCFPPFVSTSGVLTVNAGAVDSVNFMGDLFSNGYDGTSTVEYKFYDSNNPSDYTTASFTYVFGSVGIVENGSRSQFEIFPNPASGEVKIAYNFSGNSSSELRLHNTLGAVVSRSVIPSGQGVQTVTVSHLPAGLYYYSLFENGKSMLTKKLVITGSN